ncbi:helix-turn-helix domain-containing protein [Nitrososphaera sp. AFS]|uniref:helix-turn-helix domain-containing protein n=1 Tax=Nitrososphaera sp. AFS TaxID=2301191 RepID=UPI00139226CD|nr:hypothetical protein [Nitrososphaera sp. AFS]
MIDWSTEDQEALDDYIIELSKSRTIRKIAKIFGVSHNTIRKRIKNRGLKIIFHRKKINDWKAIVEHIRAIDLPFYKSLHLYPVELRQLYYRLIEVGLITKSQSNYNYLSRVTSEARRGCTSDFLKPSRYGKLPLDCIIDKGSPDLLGSTDLDKGPSNPTPAEWPDVWEEHLNNGFEEADKAIDALDELPDDYDGKVYGGSDGVNPGKWWHQPKYVEVWVEAANLIKTLDSLIGDIVKVTAAGGVATTYTLAKNCERIKKLKESHDHIKQVIILYCGDLDSTGDWLDEYLVNAIQYYTGWTHHKEFEVIRVAVTPEQILEWNLVENPEYNTEENKDPRFERFADKYPELVKKYGEKFGIQVEAMLTTKIKIKRFEKLLRDKILSKEYWDEDLWKKECPPNKYDYEANHELEPQPFDIDNDLPDPESYFSMTSEESDMDNTREIMERRIKEYKKKLRDKLNKMLVKEDDL